MPTLKHKGWTARSANRPRIPGASHPAAALKTHPTAPSKRGTIDTAVCPRLCLPPGVNVTNVVSVTAVKPAEGAE